MKKYRLAFGLIACLIFISSCGNRPDNPADAGSDKLIGNSSVNADDGNSGGNAVSDISDFENSASVESGNAGSHPLSSSLISSGGINRFNDLRGEIDHTRVTEIRLRRFVNTEESWETAVTDRAAIKNIVGIIKEFEQPRTDGNLKTMDNYTIGFKAGEVEVYLGMIDYDIFPFVRIQVGADMVCYKVSKPVFDQIDKIFDENKPL